MPYNMRSVNEKTGLTANEFRQTLSKLVEDGAVSLFFAGEQNTSTGNLPADHPEDPMHLSEEGAVLLGR